MDGAFGMVQSRGLKLALLASALATPFSAAQAQQGRQVAETIGTPEQRAAATEALMTPDERMKLVSGIMPLPGLPNAPKIPADALLVEGYVPGIPRLGVPSLQEQDAGMGVSSIAGIRKDPATALPSSISMAATWNPALVERAGVTVGGEFRAKGINVVLNGGLNLMREPRGGRTFEYMGEDPLLAGIMAGAEVRGIQSTHLISTMKHFALNDQETARGYINAQIDEAAARESDLLAFEIGIEQGKPGAIMCAYNKINGVYACENDWLLNTVLKHDWKYPGFVMSDWGGVHSLESALNGLDQQSGFPLDDHLYFGDDLRQAAEKDSRYLARLQDMNRRVLRSIYASGIDRDPPVQKPIDFKANAFVAQEVAREGVVLLRNRGDVLPLIADARRVAVIGGYANLGVLSGGGGSQVGREGKPAATIPQGGSDPLMVSTNPQVYWGPSPLDAMRARSPNTDFVFRDGRYLADAASAAKSADVAIVFATQWRTEGLDVPELNLPNGQDQLIEAVAAANKRTIVVLETGGPIIMPWIDNVAAVVEAWYPGTGGDQTITSILYGDTNPSGRLPVTFPVSIDQLAMPELPGAATVEPDMMGRAGKNHPLTADYRKEGSDVGYRWYSRSGTTPLFAFGHGLSYTRFEHSPPQLAGGKTIVASFTIRNIGSRTGADVPQLYLVSAAGQRKVRLLGWDKIKLEPGASKDVTITADPRLLADWKDGGWQIAGGAYGVAVGASATDLGPVKMVELSPRRWGP